MGNKSQLEDRSKWIINFKKGRERHITIIAQNKVCSS